MRTDRTDRHQTQYHRFLIMTILCCYQSICEDHDAIDDGRVDERPIRGL
ncbi:uncharacterized protein BCN122_III0481 [Burkholderia cenocepacia]|nr:uncharacterized protein BCN122_III0481 [Burkholderia cenocepacia]